MPNRSSILRWALPPGVSLAIHAALVVLLVVVGSRAAAIAAGKPKATRLPLAELEYIAPLVPQASPDPEQTRVSTDRSSPKVSAETVPSVLDRSARDLASRTPVSSQAMSAATLDQLARQSTSLSAEPGSAPVPISFAGVSTGAARSIVYVIDTSGATLTSLSYIHQRLLQSIDRLSPTQRFQVIAFRELTDSTYTTPELQTSRGKLPRATRENKGLVAKWLEGMPAQGRSNPVDGLAAAIALEPDMILLISRGIERTEAPWAGGLKSVRTRLEELNPLDQVQGTRPIVIKTIQLLNEDPTGIMRAIGIFHGDGHNDHQVITYSQLVSPDPAPRMSPPSNTDARLTSVEDQLAGLKASGSYYRATTSVPTDEDIAGIDDALVRINPMLSKADPEDPRAALLAAESLLLSGDSPESQIRMFIDALSDAVFVSPELDARRRIVVAQLYSRDGDSKRAIAELVSLLEERSQLNLSTLSAAHAILVLSSMTDLPTGDSDQEPFSSDPAWALMLAETQSLYLLSLGSEGALSPLLELRRVLPGYTATVDGAIVRVLESSGVDRATLPDLVRFLYARARLTGGSQDERLEAIRTLKELGAAGDEGLAEQSLWLACLGARAINTRESGEVLMLGASELAQRFPEHEGASDALAGAIDTAVELKSPYLIPLLRQVIGQYPNRVEIDLWKLRLIDLIEGPEQLAMIESLTPATRESDMGAEIYHTLAMDQAANDAAPSERLGQAAKVASALDRLRSPLASYWHRIAAELETDTDPASAAVRLERLVEKNINHDDPDLELLYARALLGAGRPDEALARLTSLAASLNTNPNKHFWHSWTLILETVVVQGNASDKDSARAHLTRLRLIDPNLGPEPFRTRLIKAQNTLHSQP